MQLYSMPFYLFGSIIPLISDVDFKLDGVEFHFGDIHPETLKLVRLPLNLLCLFTS